MRRQSSEAAEGVLALVCGYKNALNRWLVVLQANIDDGGERKPSTVFLLAALIAPVSAWMSFTEEWQGELDSEPRIEYFKLKHAVRANGPFKKLKHDPKARQER